MISSMGRPLIPPVLLMWSTAIWVPTSAVLPPAAAVPDRGCMVPILYALAWPNALRHHAGTATVAPRAPAAAAPKPRKRRRLVFPLYQNDSAWVHCSSCQRSAMGSTLLAGIGVVAGHGLEGRVEGLDGPLDVFFSVGERHVELLGGLDDATLEKRASEDGVARAVRGQGRPVVGDGAIGEVDLEHGRLSRHLGGDAGRARRFLERRLHPAARLEESRVGARLAQLGEGGEAGRRPHRIAVEGARLLDEVTRLLHGRSEMSHDFLASHHRGEGKAAADDLAEGGEVWHDSVVLLGAAVGEPEARHDLVEDQRHAEASRELTHAGKEGAVGHDQALEGLHDDGGQALVMRGENGLRLSQVVEGSDEYLVADRVGNARGVRDWSRKGLGRARAHAHERVVVGAVEPALELQDAVALAEGPRHAESEEGRLTPRGSVAELLRARDGAADLLREGDRRLGELEVRRAFPELRLHGGHDGGMGMPQHHGPAAQEVVDVLAPGEVIEVGASGLLDHELEVVGGIVATEHATRKTAESGPEEVAFVRAAGRRGILRRHRVAHLIP